MKNHRDSRNKNQGYAPKPLAEKNWNWQWVQHIPGFTFYHCYWLAKENMLNYFRTQSSLLWCSVSDDHIEGIYFNEEKNRFFKLTFLRAICEEKKPVKTMAIQALRERPHFAGFQFSQTSIGNRAFSLAMKERCRGKKVFHLPYLTWNFHRPSAIEFFSFFLFLLWSISSCLISHFCAMESDLFHFFPIFINI